MDVTQERLLDLAAEASAAEGIRRGLEDLEQGRTRPAKKFFDELRAEYGIPRERSGKSSLIPTLAVLALHRKQLSQAFPVRPSENAIEHQF